MSAPAPPRSVLFSSLAGGGGGENNAAGSESGSPRPVGSGGNAAVSLQDVSAAIKDGPEAKRSLQTMRSMDKSLDKRLTKVCVWRSCAKAPW